MNIYLFNYDRETNNTDKCLATSESETRETVYFEGTSAVFAASYIHSVVCEFVCVCVCVCALPLSVYIAA